MTNYYNDFTKRNSNFVARVNVINQIFQSHQIKLKSILPLQMKVVLEQ